MARYHGRDLYVEWIDTGGTTVLSGDYRTLDIPESADEIDASAGADTRKVMLAGQVSAAFTLEILAAEAGTVLFAEVAPQSTGTLRWYPEGTTAGNQEKYAAATILGRNEAYNYNDVTTLRINGSLIADITVATSA